MLKIIIAILLVCLPVCASADRTIVMPSGYTMSDGYDAQFFYTISGHVQTLSSFSASRSNVELNADYMTKPSKSLISIGIQALALPETFQTPSVSFGIADLGNSTRSFSNDGFDGRSIYLVLSKSLDSSMNPPKIHGITLTGGIGTEFDHGIFGAAGLQLPLNFLGSAEFDGRRMNYRLAYKTNGWSSVSFNRIGGSNWLSLDLHSEISL
jgi:hypothetical protein